MSSVTTSDVSGPKSPERPRSRRGLVVALVVALALVVIGVTLALVASSGGGGSYSFGTVDVSKGTAEIRKAGEHDYQELDRGTTIAAGDAVRTSAGASATVALANGSILRIGAASGVAFEQRDGSSSRPVIRVARGVAYFRSTPRGDAVPVEITAGSTSVTGAPSIAAIGCGPRGCAVTAVAGALKVKPEVGRPVALGAGSTASLSGRVVREISSELPDPWIRDNEQTDRTDRLRAVRRSSGGGTLGEARIDGDWQIRGTVTASDAPNFVAGRPVNLEITLDATCASGPCDVKTTMGRYSGTGRRSDRGLTFTAAGTVQCVNAVTREVTDPDLGPEVLKVLAHVTKAVPTKDGPVATELGGTATYDADITAPCNSGSTGKQHADMDVTLVGPPVTAG